MMHLSEWAHVIRSGMFTRYAPGEQRHKVYVSKRDVLVYDSNSQLWTCLTGCKKAWIAIKDDELRKEYGKKTIYI